MSAETPARPRAGTLDDLVRQLLELRTWVVFDVDETGRVLAGSDDPGSIQLVEIEPDGRRTPLTALPSACSGRYVPGRRLVVVQHDDGGNERMQLSLLDLATPRSAPARLEDLRPLVADPAHIHQLLDVTDRGVVYATNRRNEVDFDVVVRDLDTGEDRVVYDADGYLVEAVTSHAGDQVAATRFSLRPASTVVSVGTRDLTDPDEHASHHSVAWTVDDRGLLLTSNHDREFKAVHRLGLDGSWTVLVADDSHDLGLVASRDGSTLAVTTLVDGAGRLAVHEVDGGFRCPVALSGDGVPTVAWSADGSRFVVSHSTPTDPGSLHLVDPCTGAASTVLDAREQMPPAVRDRLVAPTVHRVPTPDGELVPCLVYPPAAGGDPALAGSSVVMVHGGPEYAAFREFDAVTQALCGLGITVLAPNVRGSATFGKRWISLDDVERRLDAVADLAAVHAWLGTRGLDPARSMLWGGSYGGYMVLAGLTMQPDLWAGGVDIVGVSSLVTFLENTSAYRRAYREREYGSLEHDRDFLLRASPLTHLDHLVAPLFVIHGANDPRVPLSEARQIKAALDGKGVECELRVYDDEGHGLAKRANRIDAYTGAVAFVRRVLARDVGAAPAGPHA